MRKLEAEWRKVLRGNVGTGTKEDESSTGRVWAAGFHDGMAHSCLARVLKIMGHLPISRPIRRTLIFSLEILEKNNDESILILVIRWKKTGLLRTKISNHNIIYSS
jgi:hypothetical protein